VETQGGVGGWEEFDGDGDEWDYGRGGEVMALYCREEERERSGGRQR
jgi:hypothetical protein